MLARVALLLCLVVGSRQLSITEFKVPSAKESGENAELRCTYDRDGGAEDSLIIKWWWTPVNPSMETKPLYQRIGSNPASIRHNLEASDNDTITLLNLTPLNSGLYECEVSLMSEKIEEVRQHQNLVVYTPGTGPNLTISEVADGPDADDEEDVLIECKADGVAPAPDLDLIINGENFNMTEYITGPDHNGLYDIIGNATLSKSTVDGYEVRCELLFSDTNITTQTYVDAQKYDPSGALTSTTKPGDDVMRTIRDDPPPSESLQNQSGDRSHSHVSFTLLVTLGLLSQLPALIHPSM